MLAIIGGSGLTQLASLDISHKQVVRTPYGEPSGVLTFGKIEGRDVVFLARHGHGHTIPPHLVNYRANIWALAETAGATQIVSVGTDRQPSQPSSVSSESGVSCGLISTL